MHKFSVGILGASGYVGRELCGLVGRHPALALRFAAAHERRGERLAVAGGESITFVGAEEAALGGTELVFCALPHGQSKPWVERASAAGARVVDLSSDLRPLSGTMHTPYGLPELMRDDIRGARVVANPGCYATAILLALAPLLRGGLVPAGSMIAIAAASGVTGAGFTPKPELLFAEVAENFQPYAVGNEHRHLAEMRAVAAWLGADVDLLFTPHLLPVARGILATITVPLVAPLANPLAPWREMYDGEPFIELSDAPPSIRDVVRRNAVRIAVRPAAGVRQPTLIVVAAIDNLMKGAAGQAMQNANLLLGLDETAGLPI